MEKSVLRHCEQIDRCNQRGGRMLSIVDLLEAGTFDEELAAYSLAAIGAGASFMVGALPGGAGKTTVMGALLNFVPADVALAVADGAAAMRGGAGADGRRCYICHEIGRGGYYAYLWGAELRAYFDLPTAGHMLATNLHADTFEQARDQVCRDNGVSESAFRRMNLLYFLSVEGGWRPRRRIASVWESDGKAPHRQVLALSGDGLSVESSLLVSPEALAGARERVARLVASGARRIDEVRAALVGG